MIRLLVACLVAAQLLQSQGTFSATLPDDEVDDEVTLQLRSEFEQFKQTYDKKYEGAEEEENRFRFFVKNLEKARKLQEADMGTAEYGVNKFSDMSDEESDQFYNNPMMVDNSPWQPDVEPTVNQHQPSSYDWRSKGAVTPVENQGTTCRSCYAFGVAANVETLNFVKTKILLTLSKQEMVDCDGNNYRCKGGYPSNSISAIIKLGGLMTEQDYPYVGVDQSCLFNGQRIAVKVSQLLRLSQTESVMAAHVANTGPIVVTLNSAGMNGYRGGIINLPHKNCSSAKLDHVVTIVGYGTEKNVPYWIMKNSWGSNWGEQGYFRIYRGGGTCGLNQRPITAVL